MPKGPKGEKRPADVIGNAVKVMRIATGEEEEAVAPATAGATLGKLGGQARARNMTPERRAEIAKNAAAKRWGKK
jgi:catalase (peroxidase I)